jgi:hypothetical protein
MGAQTRFRKGCAHQLRNSGALAGLERVGSSYDLCSAFLAHTGLSL